MAKRTATRAGAARTPARKIAKKSVSARMRRTAARVPKAARSSEARRTKRAAKASSAKSTKTASGKTPKAKTFVRPPKASARRVAAPAKKAKAATARPTAPTSGKKAKALRPGLRSGSRPAAPKARRPPALDRARRTVAETEIVPTPPSSLNLNRSASAARSGRKELNEKLHEHTSTGPALTAGDIDADWEAAEAVGDEAPGGDNPTPDQDIVEDIGKALGVEYEDDQELLGGDEIGERDRKRWELDPASSDDFDERD